MDQGRRRDWGEAGFFCSTQLKLFALSVRLSGQSLNPFENWQTQDTTGIWPGLKVKAAIPVASASLAH